MKYLSGIISLCFLFLTGASAAEQVNFLSRPLTAGKASLTENGFIVSRSLGTANFSPDLRYPIQLIYQSASEKTGIFGFAWSSPQLESSAYYDKDGVLWTTPWGEKIKFFHKDAKESKDTVKIELYEEAKKGRGFYAPYSDWEADTNVSNKKLAQNGDWAFSGKGDHDGWEFTYRDARLQRIKAPSGRSIDFAYSKGLVTKISQNSQAFVEISYDKNIATALSVNGVEHKLAYADTSVVIMPKTPAGNAVTVSRPMPVSIRTGDLNPVEFAYQSGYLGQVKQGGFTDEFTVQTETQAERYANLQSQDRKSGVKHSGKVAGRLLADSFFRYDYKDGEPGQVKLTNKLKQTANYDYSAKTGVFKIDEFSGKSYTIYYFMRYDVAYLGNVRKIVDGRGRDVVNYRYDKLSGKVIRIRDMAENDRDFTYDDNGRLKLISRRAADQAAPEPVTAFAYDQKGNLSGIARLGADGKPTVVTAITYSENRQPVRIDNGQMQTNLSYNKYGYPESIRNAFDQIATMRYDRFNRVEQTTDIYGVTTYYTYAPAGLVSKVERKDGRELLTSLEIAYNANGQPVSYTDQQGRTKKFERDEFGRVVKEFFPDDTTVEYSYNAVGQLDTVLDQNRHEIKFDWSKFGLDKRTTAANQLTDYVYDKYGMLKQIDSKYKGKKADRSIKYEYDKFDRISKITYAEGEVETFKYNSWGKLIASTKGNKNASFKYDYFDRLIEKAEGDIVTTYAYNPWGQRISRITKNGPLTLDEKRTYDKFGRLETIESGGKTVQYQYNKQNQLAAQIVNNVPIEFAYTKYGQLESKVLGGRLTPISTLKYAYGKDGQIIGRQVDDKVQMYSYDKRGQLLAVIDGDGKPVEQYVYDPAGNILTKTVNGKTTTFTYDKANQLVSSTVDGKTTDYRYDGAGRLVQEGDKTYQYGYLDKILNVLENGETIAGFDYHMDGQIASSVTKDGTENFLWDGLALIHRGGTNYINEPAITGGNPILADGKVLFNDMLGTTLGVKSGEGFDSISRNAFGQTIDQSKDQFFTGKPYVGEIGYAFLLRNYRAEQGKWQTQDPLGYPDGFNNFAYVNNKITMYIDWQGTVSMNLFPDAEDIHGYANNANGPDGVYTVGAHGNANGVVNANGDPLTPQQLADLITNDPNYTQGQTVDLLSCNVGNGDYAQQLANILNADVGAADNYVWFTADGNYFVAPMKPDGTPDYDNIGAITRIKPE